MAAAAALSFSCAGALETGPSLADPAAVAAELRRGTEVGEPARILFRWEYGDEQGRLRGDGVARVNPPDSFRLDLFSSGEGSMSVALTAAGLVTLGEIEELELPSPPFMYAMAGVFRPGVERPSRGFEGEEGRVLVFDAGRERSRFFFFAAGRLVRMEERSGSRRIRWIEVEWGPDGAWPRRAEYRDEIRPRRVRWTLEEAANVPERWESELYDLGPPP